MSDNNKELDKIFMYSGKFTTYLNLKQKGNGKPYLQINQIKNNDDGSKEENRVLFFDHDFRTLIDKLLDLYNCNFDIIKNHYD